MLLVLGQIISVFGSALLRFVLSLYVLDLTGRADLYAALFALSNIPLLLSPLGGAVADRFKRRNLMIIFDLASSVIVLLLTVLLANGSNSVASIGVVMVLLAVISAMYAPAVLASIPMLVQEAKLEQANGIVNGVQALSGVAAPIIGGVLYSWAGAENIIGLSAIIFFLSAVMLLFIRMPSIQREWEGPIVSSIVMDMQTGFVYVFRQRFMVKALLLAALLNLVLTPLFVVGGPIILRMTMQSSETMYGIGMGIIEGAAIAGALTVGVFAKRMRMNRIYRWLLVIAVLIVPMAGTTTTAVVGMGKYPAYILFMLCAVPIAALMTMIAIYVITHVQKHTPNEHLGKVMAIMTMAAQCAAPLGQVAYGLLFEAFSTMVYVTIAAASLAMFVIAGAARKLLINEGETV
jgi:MFS family permease